MLPIRSRSEFAYCTRSTYVLTQSVAWARGEGSGGTQARGRRGVRRRRPDRARGQPLRRAPGRGRARQEDDRRAPRRGPAGRDRLVRPRPARPRDQGRAARRLERGRLRRASASRRRRAPSWPAALAEQADRRVYLREFAVVGAESSDLAGQVDRALPIEPDVAVILIGANDVTHQVRPAHVGAPPLRGRTPAARRRRRGGGRHLPRPRHPQADRAAAEAGGPRLVAPARGRPDHRGGRERRRTRVPRARSSARSSPPRPPLLFGPDQFHPSAAGYRSLVGVLLPSALAALGLAEDEAARAGRGEGVLPIADAAIQAVRTPAPSSTAPRSAAAASASAASGSSCGTAAASRPRTPGPRGRRGADEVPSRRAWPATTPTRSRGAEGCRSSGAGRLVSRS